LTACVGDAIGVGGGGVGPVKLTLDPIDSPKVVGEIWIVEGLM